MKRNTRAASLLAGLALAAFGLFAAAPAFAATVTSDQVAFVANDIEFSAVSADGSLIAYSVYGEAEIMLLNTATHEVTTVSDINALVDGGGGLVFSPDGAWLYVANHDGGNVVTIDVANAAVLGNLASAEFDSPWVISISPDGNLLYVGDYEDNTIVTYDLSLNTATSTPSVDYPYAMFISPDGSKVYNVDYYGDVDVFDTATKTVTTTFTNVDGDFYSACTNPDVTVLYLPDGETPALFALSLTSGELLATNSTDLPAGKNYSCAVSPDGAKVFVTNVEIGAAEAPPAVTVPGVVTEFDGATLAYVATHTFSGVAYTQVMNFYDECNAFVTGFYGNAQGLQLGGECAPPAPEPALAKTGMNPANSGALLAGALVAGTLALVAGRRLTRR